MDKAYLTQERYNELLAELNGLKMNGRKEVAERLRHAKELGDLSENSEYQQAREDQMRLEQKIGQLDELLKKSVIIKKPVGSGVVRIGSKVKVKRNKEIIAYTIVGSNEANPVKGLISNESPLGRSLLGKKIGDTNYVTTPKGEVCYQILSIE